MFYCDNSAEGKSLQKERGREVTAFLLNLICIFGRRCEKRMHKYAKVHNRGK